MGCEAIREFVPGFLQPCRTPEFRRFVPGQRANLGCLLRGPSNKAAILTKFRFGVEWYEGQPNGQGSIAGDPQFCRQPACHYLRTRDKAAGAGSKQRPETGSVLQHASS